MLGRDDAFLLVNATIGNDRPHVVNVPEKKSGTTYVRDRVPKT